MTGIEALLVAGAGAVGAVLRHELTTRATSALLGVHLVNVTGALALGAASVALDGSALLVLGGGLLGGMTTFSTWMVLADDKADSTKLGRHIALPFALGVLAATAGRTVVVAILGVVA
jgi:fluoride ion exporter CrcB/FEX